MEIIDLKFTDEPRQFEDCGLVLGNFDGVHRGHRALIDELKRLNANRGQRLPLGAFCFARHPSHYFGAPVPHLCTNEEKMALLREAGLQFVILCDFPTLRDLSPEDFVRDILIRQCHCRMAVCGYNYTFGAKGAGKAEDLARWLGSQPDCAVSIVPPVMDGDNVISSSAIRRMLEGGHPEDATRLLGRPFSLRGTVTDGRHVGNKMGYPTANVLFPRDGLIPAHGVYAVTVRVGRQLYLGISNVGTRPTFDDDDQVNCETFLFDFNGNLYGKTIQVSFLRFLRPERAFPSAEALYEQVKKDIQYAKQFF